MISATQKKQRRQAHHLLADQLERGLGMTTYGKGRYVAGQKSLMGATPNQLRAGAKQIAQRMSSRARRSA